MKILKERQKTHGDFKDHAYTSQKLKEVLVNSKNWKDLSYKQKEALEMIVHKIARIMAGNPDYEDHWVDIAGYSTLCTDKKS